MRILGIESSSLVASVALVTDDRLTAEYTVDFKKTHSQTLLPMLDEIARMLELDLSTVDAIAVAAGPGSFTGLRIGGATAKGLGLALNKPLVHVPTVDAMAYNLWGCGSLVCPLMDAKRRQVYTGIYRMEPDMRVIQEQCAMDAAELAEELNGLGEPVVFLGDGVPVYGGLFEELLTIPFSFAPPQMNRQRAASVAALGRLAAEDKEGRYGGAFVVAADDFAPDYLRKPQAEREREARLNPEGRDGRLAGDN